MENRNIACVIVTYNRKQLLKRCLDAVNSQSFKPSCVYITDNASTDGTMESVKEWGYYNCHNNGIEYKYVLNAKNEGGSGGFYLGMTTAMKEGDYDALWVMDDDGAPCADCLNGLVNYLDKYDYIAPLVLSDQDHKTCSFVPDCDYDQFCTKATNGIVKDWASPFNGILYSKKLISTIGYPKKDMFIWGDEENYHFRSINHGYSPVTVIDSIHYHPVDRMKRVDNSKYSHLIDIQADWKLYCYVRNHTYNCIYFDRRFSSLHAIYRWSKIIFDYMRYFNFELKDHSKNNLLISAFFAGVFKKFDGLSKYFNN